MKKSMLMLGLGIVLGLLLSPIEGNAQMGPEGSEEWNYCPYCGGYIGPETPASGYGRGPGMRGRDYGRGHGRMDRRRGMGPGMMGPGHGRGPGSMHRGWGRESGAPYGPQYQPPREPLKEKDAKEMVENYVRSTRNPNLKMGTITEKDTHFEVEILTKDGSLADNLAVDKTTGWMRSIY